MLNIIIKAVIFDENSVQGKLETIEDFAAKVKEYGTKVVLYRHSISDEDYSQIFDAEVINADFAQVPDKIRVPAFHCMFFSSTESLIKNAAENKFKTIAYGNEELKENSWQYIENIADIDVLTFLETGRFKPYEVDVDAFIEREIDPSDVNHIESVFALGNGYLGLRGTYDERDDKLSSDPGMYINGIFEKKPLKYVWDMKGLSRNEQFTINIPDWRIIEMYIDGEKAVTTALSNHFRKLDMRNGVIERTFRFTSANGKTALVESTRIVNMFMPHSAEIKYSVTPLNFEGDITIKSVIVKNTPINGRITTETIEEKIFDEGFALINETEITRLKCACAFKHKIFANEYSTQVENNNEFYEMTVNIKAVQNEKFTLEKYAAFYSSADKAENMFELAVSEAEENSLKGFEFFKEQQRRFWDKHWENADVEIEGNDADQQAVRLSLFHIKQQLPTINDASIGATGITGSNYSGRVFWDTEMYLMPYYLYTNPESCKTLLMYRYNLLESAINRAKELDGVGARYAWATINGEETGVVYEASGAEYHINSAIAYAIWAYYRVTNDSEFVYNFCAEVLFETAKYMAHRGNFLDARDGRFCLNLMCGPDEYACGANNNCYTNLMTQFHLRFALEIYHEMQEEAPKLLSEIVAHSTGIDNDELKLWKDAADKMYYHVNEKYGVYEQDDKFIYNDEVDMDMIPKNYDIREMFYPLDLWRIKVLKQADVVLLMFLRGDIFTLEEKKKNYDYYEPRTNHGSSLSAAIHAIMANEIGYHQDAYGYFRSTAYMDIGDFKKNTAGGLHVACLGGVWMTVVNGFLGMRHYDRGLEFNICIPKNWNSIKCNICYKDSIISIEASQKNTVFKLKKGSRIEFKANGKTIKLSSENKETIVPNII